LRTRSGSPPFAQQQRKPVTDGTLRTESLLFLPLVISSILFVGALSYLPVMALGPLVAHLTFR
jgi:K+-transporting ATPase ATPase A chain